MNERTSIRTTSTGGSHCYMLGGVRVQRRGKSSNFLNPGRVRGTGEGAPATIKNGKGGNDLKATEGKLS